MHVHASIASFSDINGQVWGLFQFLLFLSLGLCPVLVITYHSIYVIAVAHVPSSSTHILRVFLTLVWFSSFVIMVSPNVELSYFPLRLTEPAMLGPCSICLRSPSLRDTSLVFLEWILLPTHRSLLLVRMIVHSRFGRQRHRSDTFSPRDFFDLMMTKDVFRYSWPW